VTGQQVAQPLGLDAAARQRGISAAPAAPVSGFQAQARQRRDRPLGAQQRIGQVQQRIGTVGAAGVQLSAKALQARQRHQTVRVVGQPGWSTLKGAATVVSFVTLFLVVRRITRWPRHVTRPLPPTASQRRQG
jgi:hypothetical protein